MAFTDTSLAKYAMKKLLGVAHTGNAKDVGNEAEATRFFLGSKEVATYGISTTAGAVASTILDCTNATDGLTTSRLRLTVDPSSSKSYFVTVPAGHDLLNYTNPITGSAYIAGDRVSFILTKKWGTSWRPILYQSGVEISPTASQDWFLEESGVLTSEDDLSLSTNGRLGCYVYVGPTVNTLVTGVSSVSNADGTLTISPTTGAVVASINLANDNTWTGRQTFRKAPTGNTPGTATIAVNPSTATANADMLWVGVNGVAKLQIDAEGDLSSQATITAGSTVQGTQLISTVSTGTSPLSVTSQTLVTNLNADLLDGQHATSFVTNAFTTIAVSGQSNVVADSTTDTLTLVAGTNVTITTDAGTDSITINSSGAVSSVSNADGTLTISPTTGAVVASINLANDNSWSGRQTFTKAPSGSANTTSCLVVNPASATNESGLIWAGVNASNKFLVDEDGDVTAQATVSGTQLISTVSTGTIPVSVTSTTNCTNLSADMCDGRHVGTSGTTIPLLSGTNTWSGVQTFGNNISIGGATFNIASLTTNDIIQYNGTNWVNVAGGGGGAVSSVSNADGSLTISPTTGAVVASLNVGHTNTWSVLQNFTEINIGTFAPSDTDNKFSNYLQSSSTSAQTFFYNTYSNLAASGDKVSANISIESDSTAGTATMQGLTVNSLKKGSSNTTETFEAIFGYAYTNSASTGSISTLRGLRFQVELDGTGNVTLGEGIKTQIINTNTATLATAKNYYIPDAINSGGGAITTVYGIHLDKQTKGSNNYEIFLEGTGGVYFRSSGVSIHSNTTNELTLTASSQVNISNGLKIGTLNGFLKATSGVVGTSSIDISSDTNLSATSPVTLTGDVLSWNFSVANTWNALQTFSSGIETNSIDNIGTSNVTWRVDNAGGNTQIAIENNLGPYCDIVIDGGITCCTNATGTPALIINSTRNLVFADTDATINATSPGNMKIHALTSLFLDGPTRIQSLNGAIEGATGVLRASNRAVLTYMGL